MTTTCARAAVRRTLVSLLAALCAVTAPVAVVPAAAAPVSAASATLAGHPVWAHFTNPTAGRDYTILTELQRLIDAAPAGSTVRGAIHSISVDSVADALLRAQNRGVTVRVLLDGKNATSADPAVATIRQLSDHQFCTNSNGGRGCISTSADGDMHTKLFTFTSTTDPNGVARSNVVWFGSSNLTYATGPDAFNNAITVYGDAALAAGLNANFTDMWNRRHYSGNDYYDSASGRGYYQAAAADAYASPEAAGQTDTIVTRLNDLTPDADCRLRVGMAAVTTGRPRIVDLVTRFRAAGCKVWMAVGTNADGGIAMSQSVYDELLAAGVAIRRKDKVHDKFFLAYGRYGTAYQYRVYTGSQNWTQDALSENDEIFVKMAPETGATHPLYDAYYAHFNEAYNTGVTCTRSTYPCRS
ncbi:phosphatidylserine/phosphatidylglycerophosphate/cardiolipin synthase family protein [Micromonospora globbae]|uniref:phospholipase D-like domain-containing protein n=1 Tax=Micromonospora globbae TaxID=1894969 RepID=UPI0037A1F549|nr:phospholipase D-like domain-containing protein [Micromonospora globbae]